MKEKVIDYNFISKLDAIKLNLNPTMQGYFGGNHRMKKCGQSIEFADFREYVLGDDIRHIDWNLYSRFEKHFIKLFVDERQMHIQIFLDCSASMHKMDPDKSNYAIKAVAGLAYLSAKNLDKTSIRLVQGKELEDLCGIVTGKDTLFRALGHLETIKFKGESDFEQAILKSENLGKNDGLTIIISDFLTENNWKKAVDYLVYRKRQVLLVQVLSPEEMNPAYHGRMQLVDAEAIDIMDDKNMRMKITRSSLKVYKEALKDYVEEIRNFCNGRGVSFISVCSTDPIENLLFRKLMGAGVIK